MTTADEQRRAATKRLRARFLEIKSDYEYKDVRHPEIGALLELLIDQEVRIENMSVVDIQSEGGAADA